METHATQLVDHEKRYRQAAGCVGGMAIGDEKGSGIRGTGEQWEME
ncbi:MAG: hypothetical protein KDE56_21000 [Anaerolineales bacterium]|nr:hypothetical protein [Anaerolineales bacterium]